MKCAHSEQDIALFVEGDLDSAALHAIQGHLAECRGCRALADELRISQASFKDLRQEVLLQRACLMYGVACWLSLTDWSRKQIGKKDRTVAFPGSCRGYAAAGVAFVLAVCLSASVVWRFSLNRPRPPAAATSLTLVPKTTAARRQPASEAEAAEPVPRKTAVVKRTNN